MSEAKKQSYIPWLAPPDAFDPVVDCYKKDVDRTLLAANLALTTDQRSEKFERNMELCFELRRSAKRRQGIE
jgi:hypothetical protein